MRSVRFESETAAPERIAEATVTVCAGGAGNSILMSWALLEDRDYTAGLYRKRDRLGGVCVEPEKEGIRILDLRGQLKGGRMR